MSSPTEVYFDFKTTSRVTVAILIAFLCSLGTCAYSWHENAQEKQIEADKEAAYRKDMFDHGYQQVAKPCIPTGELIWEKK